MTNVDEPRTAFDALLKSIACPSCGELYSDSSVQWCNAWIEGRHDLLDEMNTTERDGPVKILCMRCGGKALVDYFKRLATPVQR
jgi:hypothetical protein